jgi:Spy/CpxP family protein refolding chaperone
MTIAKRPVLWAIIAALLLAAPSGPPGAGAQGPQGGKPPRSYSEGLVMGIPLGAMNLTAEQDQRVSETLSAYHAESAPLIRQLCQAQRALADKLFASGQLGAADLEPKLQEITRRRTQLLEMSARAMVDIRNVLTPQQIAVGGQVRARLGQLRAEMRQLLQPDKP